MSPFNGNQPVSAPAALFTFSAEELRFLTEASPCAWWTAFITLAATSGIRTGEMLRLHATDIDPTTQSVRITADPLGSGEEPTLRRPLPAYRERCITVEPMALHALARLRSERPDDEYLFVPNWKVQQVWNRLLADEPLGNELICPRLHEWFRMIQSRARLLAAKSLQQPIAQTRWPLRPLSSLRATAIRSLAERMSPRSLAMHLGCASVGGVLGHYDRRLSTKGGAT